MLSAAEVVQSAAGVVWARTWETGRGRRMGGCKRQAAEGGGRRAWRERERMRRERESDEEERGRGEPGSVVGRVHCRCSQRAQSGAPSERDPPPCALAPLRLLPSCARPPSLRACVRGVDPEVQNCAPCALCAALLLSALRCTGARHRSPKHPLRWIPASGSFFVCPPVHRAHPTAPAASLCGPPALSLSPSLVGILIQGEGQPPSPPCRRRTRSR